MLELREVCKSFSGIAAVNHVTFSARGPGDRIYLGPNGSGKSTTIKMITAVLQMTSGEILFDGAPIQLRSGRRSGSGCGLATSRKSRIFIPTSAGSNMTMVGQLRDLPAKSTAEQIDGLLRLFSLHGGRQAAFLVPSYWFFGLFQQLNGPMPPQVLAVLCAESVDGAGRGRIRRDARLSDLVLTERFAGSRSSPTSYLRREACAGYRGSETHSQTRSFNSAFALCSAAASIA